MIKKSLRKYIKPDEIYIKWEKVKRNEMKNEKNKSCHACVIENKSNLKSLQRKSIHVCRRCMQESILYFPGYRIRYIRLWGINVDNITSRSIIYVHKYRQPKILYCVFIFHKLHQLISIISILQVQSFLNPSLKNTFMILKL